ncbi:putative nucleolar protein 10/Enp2 [Helianthus anomalus]
MIFLFIIFNSFLSLCIDYMERVDLIQDLRFKTATTRIKATPDGEFLIASGYWELVMYLPTASQSIRVKGLSLKLKLERHLISEIINFQLAFLCADRSVNLHAKYGSHYSLRIPRMGRDIIYDCWPCDLICAASSPDLYRINLEQVICQTHSLFICYYEMLLRVKCYFCP